MTALIRSAEARLSASTMISSSIRFSLVGAQVDCTTKTSRARTLVLISTVTSPSEKRLTVAAPSEMPRWLAISSASAGLALPVNTMKSGVGGATCMRTGAESSWGGARRAWPVRDNKRLAFGRGGRTRTLACRNQNPVP